MPTELRLYILQVYAGALITVPRKPQFLSIHLQWHLDIMGWGGMGWAGDNNRPNLLLAPRLDLTWYLMLR